MPQGCTTFAHRAWKIGRQRRLEGQRVQGNWFAPEVSPHVAVLGSLFLSFVFVTWDADFFAKGHGFCTSSSDELGAFSPMFHPVLEVDLTELSGFRFGFGVGGGSLGWSRRVTLRSRPCMSGPWAKKRRTGESNSTACV